MEICLHIVKQFYLIYRWDPKGTSTLDQSGSGSNSNEGVFHIAQSSETGASPSDAV